MLNRFIYSAVPHRGRRGGDDMVRGGGGADTGAAAATGAVADGTTEDL